LIVGCCCRWLLFVIWLSGVGCQALTVDSRVLRAVMVVCNLVVGRPFGCQALTVYCWVLMSVVVVCYLIVWASIVKF
jgi:hypothetical protein